MVEKLFDRLEDVWDQEGAHIAQEEAAVTPSGLLLLPVRLSPAPRPLPLPRRKLSVSQSVGIGKILLVKMTSLILTPI